MAVEFRCDIGPRQRHSRLILQVHAGAGNPAVTEWASGVRPVDDRYKQRRRSVTYELLLRALHVISNYGDSRSEVRILQNLLVVRVPAEDCISLLQQSCGRINDSRRIRTVDHLQVRRSVSAVRDVDETVWRNEYT